MSTAAIGSGPDGADRELVFDAGSAVRLWLFGLDRLPEPGRLACLSRAERERAQRFRRARDRDRYLAGRCVLRERLALFTGVPAGQLRLQEGPFGKPALVDRPDCHFNLSHSEDRALLAIGGEAPLGVDIEQLHVVADLPALARAHYTEAEIEQLMAWPDAARDEGFLRLWTRKEACLKAIGTGLSLEPVSFAVGLSPAPAIFLIEWPRGRAQVELRSLDVGPGAVAALARRIG